MTNVKECPNCESTDTERVHVEWYTQEIEEVRMCVECRTQYTINYADPVIIQEHTPNDES